MFNILLIQVFYLQGLVVKKIQLQSNTLISKPHNLSLDITKLSPQETECTLADAALNQVNFANSHSTVRGFKIGNDVSNCLLDFQACYNNYIPANGFKECRALTSQCSYADALLNQVVFLNSSYTTVGQRVGSNVENCLLMDCDENFQLAGNAKSCVPKNGNCSIADATLNQVNFANSNSTLSGSKIGTDVSSCVLDSQACLPNFELSPNAKSCVAKVSNCTSSDAILNLVNLDNSNQQVIGSRIGNNVEQCLLAPNSCSPNYLLNQSSSACIAKTCQSLDGNELADLGYDLTGATISGSFGSCIVTCNDTVNQQVANDGKSCENKPIVILPTATNPVISPTSFALDVQTPNQPTYSFTVRNNLTVTVNGPFVAIPSHKAITIVTNGCNINLTSRRNCPISYKINSELLPIGVSTHTIHVQNLTNSTPEPLTLTITVNPPQEVLVASPVSRDVTVTAPNVLTGSFSVTNKGLDQTGPFIATPSHAGITITSNNCPARLPRNRYCTISYSLDPNLLPSGLSNQSISVESTTDVTEIPFGLNITVIK